VRRDALLDGTVRRASSVAPVVQGRDRGWCDERLRDGAANINIRSLQGVKPAAAVGLPGDGSAIYVRRGVCSHAAAGALLGCVSRSG
jgi:hypothetical protein